MIFTVLLDPAAEQELAALWMAAPDRAEVTRVSHEIEQLLRTDAHERGEARTGGQRILFVPPLGVLFTVSVEDRIVRILQFWRFEQHESKD
jgi:hypothetical protein